MSSGRATPRAVRVDTPDELDLVHYDYADAFEIRLPASDPRTAEQFARDALENATWPMRAAVRVGWGLLGFRRQTRSSPGHLFGSRVVTSEPALVRLEVTSSLMRGLIVGRRPELTQIVVATYVWYGRPWVARPLWAALSPVHRWLAKRLMEHAVTSDSTQPLRRPLHAHLPRSRSRA